MTAAEFRKLRRAMNEARAFVADVVEKIHDPHIVEMSVDTHVDLLSRGAYAQAFATSCDQIIRAAQLGQVEGGA